MPKKSYSQAVSGKRSVRTIQKNLDAVLQTIIKNIQKLPTQYKQQKQQKPQSIKVSVQKTSVKEPTIQKSIKKSQRVETSQKPPQKK